MGTSLAKSQYWDDLWKRYAKAPSIAFCRVPELEYASQLSLDGTTLDHCCGDGKFAQLAWKNQQFDAGCDFDASALQSAQKRGNHVRLDEVDVSKHLPYEDNTFDLIFNNSALEHVEDVDAALAEITRVLKPGGTLAFNVLNHRYFEWWPLSKADEEAYREWQPFYHAWSRDTWGEHLSTVGLEITDVQGYFDERAAKLLALLEFEFSGAAIRNRPSNMVDQYKRWMPIARRYWMWRLGNLQWKTAPDAGAGYFIQAVKRG